MSDFQTKILDLLEYYFFDHNPNRPSDWLEIDRQLKELRESTNKTVGFTTDG